jgi:hypothetical protein
MTGRNDLYPTRDDDDPLSSSTRQYRFISSDILSFAMKFRMLAQKIVEYTINIKKDVQTSHPKFILDLMATDPEGLIRKMRRP